MSRLVVNVATGPYVKGQDRLKAALGGKASGIFWADRLPDNCPSHSEVPYAFKAYALKVAARGGGQVLWCDACIVPTGPLDRIWDYAKEHGAWFSKNGWNNYEWTADEAYPDLFPEWRHQTGRIDSPARNLNRNIPHVVATAFALDLNQPTGKAFLDEYYRLASQTKAFCGPWINSSSQWANEVQQHSNSAFAAPCGPPDVRGHRHDQTASSVIAWRLGIPLTSPPDMFAYKGGETADTVLIADGSYA